MPCLKTYDNGWRQCHQTLGSIRKGQCWMTPSVLLYILMAIELDFRGCFRQFEATHSKVL
eukprot:m.34198 g.34198  ORF g.34198 m.34198 type:complete len:60 (-) comp12279_c0_seq1:9-188(-)